MSVISNRSAACVFGSLLLAVAPSAYAEQVGLHAPLNQLLLAGFILFIIVVGFGVYYGKTLDKKRMPVSSVLEGHPRRLHTVAPETLVVDCVKKMNAERIGAVLVMDGASLVGIFTERDALKKVLGAGRDANSTPASEVMTPNPTTVEPNITVGEAMSIVATRRFRHLPVMENGEVVAMISAGDLSHWMVKDRADEIQRLVDLAAEDS